MKKIGISFDFKSSENTQLVGISGTLNAGKDTGAEHLAERHGFMHVSTGDMLRAEAGKQGRGTDRNTLITIGQELRRDYNNQGALVILAVEKWQEKRERFMGGLVITGLRAIGEAEEVPQLGGRLIFVDAPLQTRYERMLARKRDAETGQTLEEFAAQDWLEFVGKPDDPTYPNLRAIMNASDIVIQNDQASPELYLNKLDAALGLAH